MAKRNPYFQAEVTVTVTLDPFEALMQANFTIRDEVSKVEGEVLGVKKDTYAPPNDVNPARRICVECGEANCRIGPFEIVGGI